MGLKIRSPGYIQSGIVYRFCSGLLRAILAVKGRSMRPTDVAAIHSDEFKRDAVRIAQSSKDQKTIRGIVFPEDGLTRRQVASDLGIGHSTLGKWVRAFSEEAKVPAQDAEVSRVRTSGCAKRTACFAR